MSLSDLYAQIPRIECRGLCHQTCGVIPLSPNELSAVRKAAGRRIRSAGKLTEKAIVLKPTKKGSCPLLDKDNLCSVYDSRPLICRLYGTAEGLECEWGCKPDYYLTKEQASDLIASAGL